MIWYHSCDNDLYPNKISVNTPMWHDDHDISINYRITLWSLSKQQFWEDLHSHRKTSFGLISSSSINRSNHSWTRSKHKEQRPRSRLWPLLRRVLVSWPVVSSRYRKSWRHVSTSREARRNMLESYKTDFYFGNDGEVPNLKPVAMLDPWTKNDCPWYRFLLGDGPRLV